MKDRLDLQPRFSHPHAANCTRPTAAGLVFCPVLVATHPLMVMAGGWSPFYLAALEQAQQTLRLDAFRRDISFSLN